MKWIVLVTKQRYHDNVPLVGREPRVWIAQSFSGHVHPYAIYPNYQRDVTRYVKLTLA